MARIISLYDENERFVEHVTKCLAELMGRRLLWEVDLKKRRARIVPLQEIPVQAHSIRIPSPMRQYIPATLPPAEVPQVHFKPPTSLAQWRDSHQEWLEALR